MINKTILRRRLIEQDEYKKKILTKPLIERELSINLKHILETPLIKAIIGPRRAGKTTLGLMILQNHDFYYLNFDDDLLSMIKQNDLNQILEVLIETFGKKHYILLDEIQNIKGWEFFVNRLQRLEYNVIITGSNSKLLSKELSSHLGGRVITIEILPFSFKEFLEVKNFDLNLKETEENVGLIKNLLLDYLKIGGFPEILINQFSDELIKSYHEEIFRTIIERDLVTRFRIRFPTELKALGNVLMNYFSSRISLRKLSKEFGISVHTIKKYINYFEEAYLFLLSKKFSYKPKISELSIRKIFSIDNGLVNSLGLNFSENLGRLMENLVAIELKRRNYELFYYLTRSNKEVDFVVKDNGIQIMQVVNDMDGIPEREIKSGVEACKELGCKKLLIVTWDYEANEDGIKFIPLWKWLLGKE